MSKSVLIVEDEPTIMDIYAFLLSKQGYQVHTAKNGEEGLELLQLHHPDVVLLDIFMPVMDGKEFLRNIDVRDFPHTKIVVCSNLSDVETLNEMLELGAHQYVVKATLSPKDLIQLVAGLTGSESSAYP